MFILLHDIASWRNHNWSSCLNDSNAWTLHRCPWNFDIWQLQLTTALPRTTRGPIVWRWGTIGYNMKLQILPFRREMIMQTRLNGSFQHLYPVAAWMNDLLQKARLTASSWYHDVDITKEFLVLKLHQNNTMSSGCFMVIWIFFCLPLYSTKLAPWLTFRWWIGGKDPVHQIYMQAPHCQVPSVSRHALTWHWLWYDIILVGQRECISSEHFSEGVCPGLMYLVTLLMQLMLIP